jgi:hypothetical protein
MPYAAGVWTEYPQPPPEQYAGPWPPEQYAAYAEQYANPAVSVTSYILIFKPIFKSSSRHFHCVYMFRIWAEVFLRCIFIKIICLSRDLYELDIISLSFYLSKVYDLAFTTPTRVVTGL